MKKVILKLWFFGLTLLGIIPNLQAKCEVVNNQENQDLLVRILGKQEVCPQTVLQLKMLLEMDGLRMNPAIVANRGFHNPAKGSFSIFESTNGFSKTLNKEILNEHFYFGHFTIKNRKSEISLDQENSQGKLLIELMAYDFEKKVYNFYELIGSLPGPIWVYRGDSFDIYNDNKNLKNGKSKPSKLRCSACHISGGPIMKELEFPHADWWTETNRLDFGNGILSNDLSSYINQFIDAAEFAQNVKNGIHLLEETKLANDHNVREKLKPLFCTTEINLKSDSMMFLNDSQKRMSISSDVFINPLLVKSYFLNMKKEDYSTILFNIGMSFPESHNLDAQFGFHAPVKGYSDLLKITKLIDSGFITREFALDILAFDMKNPLFSKKRCSLLQLIPNTEDWFPKFRINVKATSNDKLYSDLIKINAQVHIIEAKNYLEEKESSWQKMINIENEVIRLDRLRKSVFEDEISKNPRGQILEPGFRVIFPTIK